MEKFYVPTRSVCAAVVLWFVKNQQSIDLRGGEAINAMTDKIIKLKGRGLDTTDVSIRHDIGRLWTSDDLITPTFFGFGERVLNNCRAVIREDHKTHPAGIEKLIETTGLGFLD